MTSPRVGQAGASNQGRILGPGRRYVGNEDYTAGAAPSPARLFFADYASSCTGRARRGAPGACTFGAHAE